MKMLVALASVLSIAFTLSNACANQVAESTKRKNAEANASAETKPHIEVTLDSLTNYQVNNDRMVSSGLPSAAHFQLLKDEGISRVIDLIPGERGQEKLMVEALSLDYHNIQVEWEHPTLANFKDYTGYMAQENSTDDKVLTHCKLNWRGAVFTYLYRITALGESELLAKQDLLAIWQPNQTWFQFINTVIDDFNQTHDAQLVTSVTPQVEPLEQ